MREKGGFEGLLSANILNCILYVCILKRRITVVTQFSGYKAFLPAIPSDNYSYL